MAELRRLMVRHRLASEQLREIEAARDRVLTVARPDREERMIRLLVQIVGLGVETATVLVREMLCRSALVSSQPAAKRSEEHTSELQSLMRISYAVFCLKKKILLHLGQEGIQV